MKKIIVVVKGEKIIFQGNNLNAIDSSSDVGGSKILIIQEMKDGQSTNIAVFRHWDYWREIRDFDQSMKSKLLIRPKHPWCQANVKTFYDSLKANDIIVLPSDLDVIIIEPTGETKIF